VTTAFRIFTIIPIGIVIGTIGGYSGEAQVILSALKRYGMFVADNGSSWFISGASDARWNDEALDDLKQIPGGAFEVVQSGPLHKP